MKKSKSIILAILFVVIYIFLFIQYLKYVALFLILIFIILILIPWNGSIINVFSRIKENNIMNNIRDEKNFMPNNSKSKVALMMSGGVDSSVAAKILLDDEFHVEAFFMRNWDSAVNMEINNISLENEICQQEIDYNDAKKVCEHLNIKLHRIDFIKEYWDEVFSVFLKEIEEGLTPNPDILCNKYIKFDHFIRYIEKNFEEFKFIATGHYAKIISRNDIKLLAMSKDKFKDQTYFLAEINKNRLNQMIFPLADLKKDEVREIAINSKIPVANKKDSTGICFVGKRNFPKFLSNYFKENPGKIVDDDTGKILGKHKGVLFYTIGQRRGLNLGGNENPYFVSSKDIKNNIIFVSSGKKNEKLYSNLIVAKNFNFLVDPSFIRNGMKINFKTRHSEVVFNGNITIIDQNEIKINSKEKILAITPGQELVIYYNELCLGGGKIV